MKFKKKVFFPTILALAILTVGILSTTDISAQTSGVYPTIVERIAERFNLNKDEVKNVFDEVHEERQAEMYAMWVERLDDLVAEGTITSEQKQLILDKQEEMRTKMEEIKNSSLTFEERGEKIRTLHEEFRAWAEENNLSDIPFKFFRMGGPMMHGFKGDFNLN